MFFSEIYESWREIQYEKYEVIFEELKNLRIEVGELILDLGSANGFLSDFVAEKELKFEIVAVDIDKNSLRGNSADHAVLADGSRLPFKNYVFDAIFCIDVAHLLDSVNFDSVKVGGIVALALPARYENVFDEILDKAENYSVLKRFVVEGREKEVVALMRRTQ